MGVKSLADDNYLNEEPDMDLLESSEIFEEDKEEEKSEEQVEDQEQSEEQSDEDQEEEQDQEEADEETDEESDEEEPEDDDTDQDEQDDEPAPKNKKSNAVPAARFQKVIHERNALREELEALRSQVAGKPAPKKDEKPAEPEFDFDAKEEEYADALLVGETKKAKEIRKQINEALAKQTEQRIIQSTMSRVSQEKEMERFNSTVSAIETKYPMLDAKSKQANKDAIQEVISFRDMYLSKGMSPAEALLKSVERVVPYYAKSEPAGKKEPSERTKKSLEKAVDTANKTPPRTSGLGVGNKGTVEKIDPSKLSIEAWEKLSQAERDKLLG